uniref:Uncharacterized protein n=1 Tax=Oryza meridionalis TaxID=40149 RepID=A0A0E0C6D6_9ORYZ
MQPRDDQSSLRIDHTEHIDPGATNHGSGGGPLSSNEYDKPSGKSILLRSPTAEIENPVFQKTALTEGNPKA